MKAIYVLFFLLFAYASQAQESSFDRNSLEFQFGYSHPLNYFEKGTFGSNFGLNNIKFGYRYMLNSNLGLRGSYAFNRYITKSVGVVTSLEYTYNLEMVTSRMHTFNLELVYNLGRGLNLFKSPTKKVALLGYVGTGYTRHQNPRTGLTEQICPVNIGFSPLLSINRNMALFFDVNTVMNIQQDYRYNGEYTDHVKKFEGTKIGFHANFSIGFMIYFGTYVSHADFL